MSTSDTHELKVQGYVLTLPPGTPTNHVTLGVCHIAATVWSDAVKVFV